MKKSLAIIIALMFIFGAMFFFNKASVEKTSQAAPQITAAVQNGHKQLRSDKVTVKQEVGRAYTGKAEVALYIHTFHKLPGNFITKNEAKKLGWNQKGTLDKLAPGKSIGGDHFGNYDRKLPVKEGRSWKECDIDYHSGNRNAKRIVYSSDGLIYYTGDHYQTFERLY